MASIQHEMKENLDARNLNFVPMTIAAGKELQNYKIRRNRILENPNSTIIFNFQYNRDKKELDILIKKIKFFLNKDFKIILIYPIPQFKENISEVIKKKISLRNNDYIKNYINILYSDYENDTGFIFKELKRLNHKNLHKVYPHEIFCNTIVKNKCIAHNNNDIFFIDNLHLAKKGSTLINIDLMKIIDKIQ